MLNPGRRDFWQSPQKRLWAWGIQGALSLIALGYFAWLLTDLLKIRYWGHNPLGLYSWAYIFYRPVESALINYGVLCVIFALCGLFFYFLKGYFPQGRWKETLDRVPPGVLLFSLLLSCAFLAFLARSSSLSLKIAFSFLLFLLPFLILFFQGSFLDPGRKTNRLLLLLTVLLGTAVCWEPLQMACGPVYLMNEYGGIFSQTYLRGEKVSNEVFLRAMGKEDINTVRFFMEIKSQIDGFSSLPASKDVENFFRAFRLRDLSAAQEYAEAWLQETDPYSLRLSGDIGNQAKEYSQNLKNIKVEKVKNFYLANLLEALHQTMGRGQINHLGHILNPINESELGKPLGEIYFQYGAGYTFVLKWIMEVLGGISVENYYKTYVLYIAYFVIFFITALILFPDRRYAFAAFAIVPVCFYFLGYPAFLLAPGVIPGIHLLDVPTTLALFYYFRDRRARYAVLAALLALSSVLLNRNFGAPLALAFFLSFLFAFLEGNSRPWGYGWIFGVSLFAGGFLWTFKISEVGSGGQIFPYFLSGFYSWPSHPIIIGGTFLYLLISYAVLIIYREDRSPWKYLYLFIFVYAQVILAYYFWSGLINHLPPVIPFILLQWMVFLYGFQNQSASSANWKGRAASLGIKGTIGVLGILLLVAAGKFYTEKKWFTDNFRDHPVYSWAFDRARLVSTIDPQIIQRDVALIRKYSEPKNPKIHIVSRYDGLLPFLAHRYSAMPFFEMISFVFSEKERDQAIRAIQAQKPAYLFADRSIVLPMEDRWEVLYQSEFFQKERASHYGRYEVLREIFDGVRGDYEKIEEGELLAVYRRKGSP